MSLKFGPHWHINSNNFSTPFDIKNEIRLEKTQFIKHYIENSERNSGYVPRSRKERPSQYSQLV